MAPRNDLLIGQIALEKKLITPEQLREVLKEQPRLLGVALVSKGYLTDNQLVGLIDEQRRRMNEPADYADFRKADILFGRLTVKDGRATEEQVNKALRRQQELAEEGKILRLGEILGLPNEGVQATLKQQGKTLMSCPTCGARFNVVGYLGGKAYQCKKCGMKLEIATAGIGADETAFNLPAVKQEDVTKSVEDAMDDPKKRFGKYVLVRQVGEGGFGAVYRAYEKGLGRTVALKFLHSEDAEDVQRFVREAQMAAKLSHPHIVPLYEVGEVEGKHYLAMEFVEGATLNKLRVEPKRALEMLRDVAGAVQYAHEKGIIHRDIKPHNLMIGENNHVWVLDFGLARQVKHGTTLTISGATVGTPAYMPPEQAEGRKCDERSDVYALGATLYELVTGHPPFEGPEALAILDKVRSEDPIPPRKFNPKLDPEIETIIAKAMEKTPARRYGSAKDFAEDLRRHLEGEPILAKPSSVVTKGLKWAKRHRAVSAVSAVVLAGLLALAAVLGVSSVRFRAKIRDLEARAKEAEDRRDLRGAADLYGEIKALLPAHPSAAEKAVTLRLTAESEARAAEKREAARRFIEDGRKAREDYDALRRRRDDKRAEAKRLEEEIPKHEGPEKKRPLWTAQTEADGVEEETALRYTDTLVSYTRALGVDPDNAEAKTALAKFYYDEYEEAERGGKRLEMKKAEKLVGLFDDGTYGPKLAREGTIEIESNPPGAEVELLRYEEGPDRRLVAKTVRMLGTCRIAGTRLEGGSYLLILRKTGCREVRYPVLIERGTRHVGKVNLYSDEEIGKEFVYVPGGKFVMGGDPEAYLAGPRREVAVEDFFIAKNETTMEEYFEFLNDRSYHTADQAWSRTPRESAGSGQFAERSGPRIAPRAGWEKWGVMGISWDDAKEYCAWLTKRGKARGESWTYRLPTEVEWEKAARGVDGRSFPWGNHFDWSFTKGGESRERKPPQPEAIGAFELDESPYGVRDMGGSMREWCGDWYDEKSNLKCVRGGAWGSPVVADFRSASRYGLGRTFVDTTFGFRLVRARGLR